MKKILVLLLISTLFAQGSFGFGKNTNGFTFSIALKGDEAPYFFALGGNGSSIGSDAYDFKPGLFNDPELGKEAETFWIAGGYIVKASSLNIMLGGGVSYEDKYFKYRDPSEILGDDKGIYYVKDDSGSKTKPCFYIGCSIPIGDDESIFNELGISFVTSYSDLNVNLGFSF